ncbi:MAG: pdxB [Gammaproteobacteria bacterium]|jgi:erythronate-4-phosphate dehydrogenase|nr:pdxB [Gammaproteobacteria bacterium]
MKLVADTAIPLIDYFFADQTDVLALPFQEINAEVLRDAEILLTRSQFKVDHHLLQNSQLKFIGSCVTGTDHLDFDYLRQHNISWYAAEGCNTQSVVEYVLSIIAALMADKALPGGRLKVGIIGVGKIGSRLRKIFSELGWELILNDPIRARDEQDFLHTSLKDFKDLDFVTIHTPLTQSGPYATMHLLGKEFIKQQKPGCVLLNTARGPVINSADLLQYGEHLRLCLDVWEHEPNINLNLLDRAYIATPHIAGHSVQAKQRGTEMVYAAVAKHFGWPHKSMPIVRKSLELDPAIKTWQDLLLALMDPRLESARMRQAIKNQAGHSIGLKFSELRQSYPKRYELEYINGLPSSIPAIWSIR